MDITPQTVTLTWDDYQKLKKTAEDNAISKLTDTETITWLSHWETIREGVLLKKIILSMGGRFVISDSKLYSDEEYRYDLCTFHDVKEKSRVFFLRPKIADRK